MYHVTFEAPQNDSQNIQKVLILKRQHCHPGSELW